MHLARSSSVSFWGSLVVADVLRLMEGAVVGFVEGEGEREEEEEEDNFRGCSVEKPTMLYGFFVEGC